MGRASINLGAINCPRMVSETVPGWCPTLNNTLKGERSIPAKTALSSDFWRVAGNFFLPGRLCRALCRPAMPPEPSTFTIPL